MAWPRWVSGKADRRLPLLIVETPALRRRFHFGQEMSEVLRVLMHTIQYGIVCSLCAGGKMSCQSLLLGLQDTYSDPDWLNKPNSWVRNLNARHLSDVAAQLVHLIVGGSRVEDPSAGYKILSGDMAVEVRVSTLSRINGYPSLSWQNIKLEYCSHIAFVALYPCDVRVFILPVVDIPHERLGPIRRSPGQYQVVTARAYDPPAWMVPYEVHAPHMS